MNEPSEPMPSDVFPLPALTPLTQLNVQDNLRINAERWQLAHQYHQQRQNVHYQALWQPGIVYGLGVKLIAPPVGIAPQFQTKSWIEVQPGFAIDGEGNPIVVSETTDRTYPITIPPLTQGVQTLHIVLRHVDPRHLELPNSTDRLQEQFRFDQRVNRLDPKDIELCRVRLSPGQDSLAMPAQGLSPALGELDLTRRRFAQLRSQRSLNLGILPQSQYYPALTTLCQAMQVLYPSLHCQLHPVTQIDPTLDAICLEGNRLIEWHQSPSHSALLQAVKDYSGSLIIVAERFDSTLQESLRRLQRHLNLQPVVASHLMARYPFLFGKLPDFSQASVWIDGRIVIVPSTLFDHWQGKDQSRETIRTWHEFGINLLYYVWYSSHIQTLLR
ncbi:hypothetical protein IQ260_08950 [Leptolyngbya cf. ectocarpi LEGE 11479]|uniref:DUF4159 domain-containing protein n=1 Tax=Leptolyngbya cf. ectocarpi LEGE 11479 TaxID=1828722 RepID=A0A928ZTR0_LEPEC|nr:hypothetical protein [Leptolyngbya ectocarpi]MBE9066779.1 hypothetical protein [Leptolyngbya cf. ectocarpi LEGE 11479]